MLSLLQMSICSSTGCRDVYTHAFFCVYTLGLQSKCMKVELTTEQFGSVGMKYTSLLSLYVCVLLTWNETSYFTFILSVGTNFVHGSFLTLLHSNPQCLTVDF